MTGLVYTPDGETLKKFILSPAMVRLIQGPRGSGKSRLACITLFMEALKQEKAPNGIRYARTYVVRRTYDELRRTTVNTWLTSFPEEKYGRFTWSKPFEHHIKIGDLDWEVVFLALDQEKDLEKLKSAEISNAWINEFGEISRDVITDMIPCLGRYPEPDKVRCTRKFLIGDTNPSHELHWFTLMSKQSPIPSGFTKNQIMETVKPPTWEIFIQPPGMFEVFDAEGDTTGYRTNPDAENLKWVGKTYYDDMIHGMPKAKILRFACNKPSSDISGDRVWPEYQEHFHVAKSSLQVFQGHPILVGIDFGRTPAAVMAQRVFDRWFILSEIAESNCGAKQFAGILKRHLAQHFPNYRFQMWGDPAGDALSQSDDTSPFLMFRAAGLHILPAPSNDLSVRLGAGREVLNAVIDGAPRLLIDPSCTRLKTALGGGYCYADRTANQSEAGIPLKNEHSHIADAFSYLIVGAGEGRALLGQTRGERKVVSAPPPPSVFRRNLFKRPNFLRRHP